MLRLLAQSSLAKLLKAGVTRPDVDDYRSIMAFSKTAAVVALMPILLAYFSVSTSGPLVTAWFLGSTIIYLALCYVSFLFDIERFSRATAKFKKIIVTYVCLAALPWMTYPWAIQLSRSVSSSDIVISTLACAGVSWAAVFMICRVMQVSYIFSVGVVGSLVASLLFGDYPSGTALIPLVIVYQLILMMFGLRVASIGRERDSAFNELKSSEKDANRKAYTDAVTGLPNRAAFNRDLEAYLSVSGSEEPKITLAIMDLDLFKNINDSHGHDVGDEVLRETSQRVADLLGPDWDFYRMGGDEFAFIASGGDINDHNRTLIEVGANLSEPFLIGSLKLEISASIGIARRPDHVNETLLSAAEIALRDAKKSLGGKTRMFDASLSKTHAEILEIDSAIRRNLKDDLIEIHYQPQICFKSGQLRGLEALSRLRAPEGGYLNTQAVFDVAEMRGLSQILSRTIFAKVERDFKQIFGNTDEGTTVSINISPADLRVGSPLLETLEYWKAHGIPTYRIRIELTEECILGRGSSGAVKFLEKISSLGYTLSLDDFGTGHASLANLRNMAIDELKIDKQFVDDMGDTKNEAILSGIIELAEKMGISCVVEGIESSDQFLRLSFMNARIGQGYYWSEPSRLDDLINKFSNKDVIESLSDNDPVSAIAR